MTEELFAIPPCDSPRLAWLKKHQVTVKNCPGVSDGNDLFPWTAFVGNVDALHVNVGAGATEDEAIVALAVLNGWKLWNEL